MTTGDVYLYEDVETTFLQQAARYVHARYRKYGVTLDDCTQEIWCWLSSKKGQTNVKRWLANDPQQTTRIRRSMTDVAIAMAEKEKAAVAGYDTEDVQWYSPSMVKALLPLALDVTYDGQVGPDWENPTGKTPGRSKANPAHGNEILASVVDIRRALSSLDVWVTAAVARGPDYAMYDSAVEAVVGWLGGPSPYVGSRKAMTNSAAQAITRGDSDG